MTDPDEKPHDLELESLNDKRLERGKKLDKLLKGVSRENIHAEIDSGPPVGKEVW
jgi:antitoxin component of MazEF toxin-antitoxin module